LQIVLGSYPAGSHEEVKSDPEEPPKEDSSPSSAESQEKVKSDPKELSKEDPNPPSETTLQMGLMSKFKTRYSRLPLLFYPFFL
jgi:hypothetical protein